MTTPRTTKPLGPMMLALVCEELERKAQAALERLANGDEGARADADRAIATMEALCQQALDAS